MKKLFPYITFACLTAFAATTGLPVIAGGCSNHSNESAEIKCDKDDKECQTKKTENFNLNKAVRS